MKRILRLIALADVAAGAVMVGYSFSEGLRRGFALDFDGNWDPVLVGVAGAITLAAGAFAYAYFGHPEAGIRRRRAFAATVRRAAVFTLVLGQCAGVAGATYGFIMFLALGRAGESAAWAAGLAASGVVACWAASHLLPWARGDEDRPKPEISASGFDERDGRGP